LRQKLTIVALGIYWPTFFVFAHIPIPERIREAGVSDKCLHLLAYMILTFLLWNSVRPGVKVRWRKASWLVLLGVLAYAVVDEWSQGLIGRSCDVRDLAADVIGAVAALVLMSFVSFRPAGLVVTACTIFGIANVSRVNLSDVIPVASSAFYFVAYGALTTFWMECAGLMPVGGRVSARWIALAVGVPVVFLAAVSGSSVVLRRTVSGQSVMLSLAGIGVAALIVMLTARRCSKEEGERAHQ
jgi:VanZ family protein